MASMVYRRSKIATRLLYKVRHHKGHGVHSPFVFDLINNVIEEKRSYYSYQEIQSFLDQNHPKKLSLKKEDLLSFRLVNYFGAHKILEIGAGNGVNTLCLAAPSSKIECLSIEADDTKRNNLGEIYKLFENRITLAKSFSDIPDQEFDCIYLDLNNYNDLSEEQLMALVTNCHEKSFIVIKGIRRNKKQNQLWKCLKSNERRTAELDLFNTGILFFDKQLYRWKYQISF